MSGDGGKEQSDKNVLHLDEAERLPSDPSCNAERSTAGRSHGLPRDPGFVQPAAADEGRPHNLPAVPASSQAAEVVKQIIEQILVNERRRARIEFVQISAFFLVFLFAILGTGIWFARQLLVQLREERQLTEQTWRMMAGQNEAALLALPAAKPVPPALNREEVAKLEQDINAVSELLKNKPQSASASVRNMLQNQQNTIQALSAQLNEVQAGIAVAPEESKSGDSAAGGSASGGFISAPLAKDLNLRMPMPSL